MEQPKRDKYGNLIGSPSASGTVPAADDPYEKPTVLVRSGDTPPPLPARKPAPQDLGVPQEDNKTQFFRRPRSESTGDTATVDSAQDLPVGWLVVVAGPGRGRVATIGYGWNKIGRADKGNRIVLNFGDRTISSEDHASINYDEQTGAFKIAHRNGVNNTYVNDVDVDTVAPLASRDRIRIGATELMFVPLCSDGFQWD